MTDQSARPAVSGDARAMMMFEANKKSTGAAYLFWFFLGGFGAHRFYLGQTGTAVTQLLLTIGGILLSVVYVGLALLVVVWIWWIVDAFLIPGLIRNHNSMLAAQLAGA